MKQSVLFSLVLFLSCCDQKNSDFKPVHFDESESIENLKKVDKSTLENWGLKGYALNYRDYEYYKELDGNYRPLIVRVSGDDYFALMLYTFDEHGKILSEYEVSGGQCAGPTELADKIEYCPKRTSTMINPTTFIVKNVQEYYAEYDDEKPVEVDSTQWKIEIDPSGRIIEIKQ